MLERKAVVREVMLVVALMLLVAAVSLRGADWVWATRCAEIAERMGHAHSYTLVTGCMVRTPRGWFPLKAIRDIERRNR